MPPYSHKIVETYKDGTTWTYWFHSEAKATSTLKTLRAANSVRTYELTAA